MKICKLAISNEAPSLRDAMWAKPISGGFALYLLDGGTWKPVKVMDDNSTPQTGDDTAINVKNKADKVSGATNGNLASLNSKGNLQDSGKALSDLAPMGTEDDSYDDLTLLGVKKYVDYAISQIG